MTSSSQMGRNRATKADNRLPPYVYRKGKQNLVEYRPYLGCEDGKPKFGKSIYLKGEDGSPLPFTATLSEIHKAYARQVQTEKPVRTLAWLLDEYFASPRAARLAASTRKHYEHYRRAIEAKPISTGATFGQVPLDKITRGVIAKYRDSMTAPIQANRHLQFLGGVFSFALEREYMTINPVSGVEKNRQAARTHYVEDRDYWMAYDDAPDWLKAAMEIAYLCRGRKAEVLGLKTKEKVLPEGVYLKRTKGSKSEITQWSDRLRAAVDLAKSHNRDVISPYLLHGADGQIISTPAFNSAWRRLMAKLKQRGGAAFPFHDLKAKGITDHTEHASGHRSAKQRDDYIRKPDLIKPTR